ncbi:hypothetical protein P8770_02935 [Limosilactobacillus fermentum]|nr:hypothetical protein [Limosilactobacillus fermentum]MCQ2007328.1 hypothetical protein [Limosilactobacillus fermentum]MDA3761292.1 hypothetical protein [Limosilactobacillus fermentum]PJE90993.1 hypothetical protein CU093_03815 [Limosilactobacillus fermentum]WGW21992.1 hypothetical protein P8770_02935 [Limosilactobacillus fermentum]
MEGKRGSECLLKPVSNIDFNPPQPQTFEDLEQLVTEGIDYFTHSFISGKRNDLTAAEYRFGKPN